MGWLTGYDNRIKLTTDHTKIDSNLTWIPVTVFLSPTHGDCVFDELTSDANRLKIAFTKADGTTQLYGEIEKWDDANELAIIHVSRDGWAISSTADTDFYMYYDIDHADNTDFIGDIDSTPGHSVWDANFKMVQHMKDATTSTIKDSTSNNNDGTKKAANEPIEAAGKVGKGQNFDGTDDWISVADSASLDIDYITVEAIIKNAGSAATESIFSRDNSSGSALRSFQFRKITDDTLQFIVFNASTNNSIIGATDIADNSLKYVSASWDGTNINLYVNAASDANPVAFSGTLRQGTGLLTIGKMETDAPAYWNGLQDELRLSNIARSAAWIKATYNTLWDTLLAYGSKESSGNAIMFGCNF